MSNQEVVFNTEAEADAQMVLDLACCHADHKARDYNPKWEAQTTKRADRRERLDGKWAIPCCSCQDYTGKTVEDYDPANYPEPEEETP